MQLKRSRPNEPDVNLTPLIDVVFLLLIFFMVSTTFERETSITIELPEASGAPVETEKRVLEISIDKQGRYYVNGKELINTQKETLKRAIQKAAGDVKDPQVLLSADRNATHQSVIMAMDAAGQLGFNRLTITASQAPGEQ
ncbi:MAG: biopolymer transporter ExbD [Gammaproteobacteria bacterium]|nr:biopolymer transporter ExbD [Gammaproteobacteria bacterium]